MVERRDYERFGVEVHASVTSLDFMANVKTEAYITDCSRNGAKIICPVYFKPGEAIQIRIEMIGEPLEIEAKVLDCREDIREKVRFAITYSLNIQFNELDEKRWKDLLIISKRL